MPQRDHLQHMWYSPIVRHINKFLGLHASLLVSVEIREELRPQNLSFTEIAKRVGESWQVLLAEEKELYESQASSAKEKYHEEMTEYKKNDEYKEYSKYLADFKIKNASVSGMKTLYYWLGNTTHLSHYGC